MASFETHLSVTTVIVGIVTVPLLSVELIDVSEAMLLLFLGVIGGMLPDIDSDNSIPISIAFKVLSLIVPLIIIYNFSNNLALVKIALLWIFFSIVFYLLFTYVFLKLTTHRGIFHTIAMGILSGELTSIFLINTLHVEHKLAVFSGAYIFLGFMTHLILDELFSVDLLNSRLKRSFGTALKIYDKNNIFGSIVVNILAFSILFLIPNIWDTLYLITDVFEKIKIF